MALGDKSTTDKKLKILITGGGGYIGSHILVELIQAGFEPIMYDNLSNASSKVIERGE